MRAVAYSFGTKGLEPRASSVRLAAARGGVWRPAVCACRDLQPLLLDH